MPTARFANCSSRGVCPISRHASGRRRRLGAGLLLTPGLVLGLVLGLALGPAGAEGPAMPADPLESVLWPTYYQRHFSDAPVVFDQRVNVLAPATAEDSMQVPVTVDARGLRGVQEILVLADYNPIPVVLRFEPRRVEPYISFRIKLQQATPIRAAVRAADGRWHLGGVWVDAAGGGCTLPSVASGSLDWAVRLGEVYGRRWPLADGEQRLRVKLMHPMDTGLADGIPAFYLDELRLLDGAGEEHLRLWPYEPVSENPVFGFDLGESSDRRLSLRARDNNGNRFQARLDPP